MTSVLIVGAGPTGLTAAVELARFGVDVTIVDKRPDPSGFSRAVGIQPGTIKLLTPSGAGPAIIDEAVSFSAFKMHVGSRCIAELPLNFDDRSRLYGLAQDRTEHHLAEALARYGGRVRYGSELSGFSQTETGVQAVLDEEHLSFDYLIGADGVQSTVRNGLGLPYNGYDLPEEWSIADVNCDDWPDPKAFQGFLLDQQRIVIVAPLEPTRFRLISNTPDALSTLPVPMNVTRIRRSGTFQISVRQVDTYQVGRVFLAGDAAHCHSPAGGRGMNLGIADAADLAHRIASDDTEGYSTARHAEGRHVIAFSERARKTLLSANPATQLLVKGAMRTANLVPAIGRTAMHQFING